MLRQGDVFLVETTIPESAIHVLRKKQGYPREVKGIVLAAGEATGHHHRVVERNARLYRRPGLSGSRFLRVSRRGPVIDAWKCKGPNGPCEIPATVPQEKVEAAGFEVVGREAVLGVTVRHEEHLPFVIAPGDYEIRRQREYEPPKDQVASSRPSTRYVWD